MDNGATINGHAGTNGSNGSSKRVPNRQTQLPAALQQYHSQIQPPQTSRNPPANNDMYNNGNSESIDDTRKNNNNNNNNAKKIDAKTADGRIF